jgi:hypothetical protein
MHHFKTAAFALVAGFSAITSGLIAGEIAGNVASYAQTFGLWEAVTGHAFPLSILTTTTVCALTYAVFALVNWADHR